MERVPMLKPRCLSKCPRLMQRASSQAWALGSYVEMHADKRRGTMDISDIGKEALIHWNGPPLAKADSIGKAAINRIFKGDRFFSC